MLRAEIPGFGSSAQAMVASRWIFWSFRPDTFCDWLTASSCLVDGGESAVVFAFVKSMSLSLSVRLTSLDLDSSVTPLSPAPRLQRNKSASPHTQRRMHAPPDGIPL